jgi:hypothetical protein
LLQGLQLSARVEAEFGGELVTNPAVGAERVSLPAVAIQRGDQQRPQAFT